MSDSKCQICSKTSKDMYSLSCGHAVHKRCLSSYILDSLFITPEEKLRCQTKLWDAAVTRKDILGILLFLMLLEALFPDQKLYYDTCVLIEEFEQTEKVIMWCHYCKKISFRDMSMKNICKHWDKNSMSLKSKFKYWKGLLKNDNDKDSKHKNAIMNYLSFCESKC